MPENVFHNSVHWLYFNMHWILFILWNTLIIATAQFTSKHTVYSRLQWTFRKYAVERWTKIEIYGGTFTVQHQPQTFIAACDQCVHLRMICTNFTLCRCAYRVHTTMCCILSTFFLTFLLVRSSERKLWQESVFVRTTVSCLVFTNVMLCSHDNVLPVFI